VRFSKAASGTRVDLEHRGWEAAGTDAVAGVEGWQYSLARYVEAGN